MPLIRQVRQDYAAHEDIVRHCDRCLQGLMANAAGREDPELVAVALSEIRRGSPHAQHWRGSLEAQGSLGAQEALRLLDEEADREA